MNFIKTTAVLLGYISCISSVHGQKELPKWLSGLWQIENTKSYESWESFSPDMMMGSVYQIFDGHPKVSTYLKIEKEGKKVIFSSTENGQIESDEIEFVMKRHDSILVFENKKNDFPQRIEYSKKGNDTILVEMSSTGKNNSYKLIKVKPAIPDVNSPNPNFNAELAQKLGADNYGMKSYLFVVLKTGPNVNKDSTFRSACFESHMANIEKLVADGKMVLAGPFGKNDLTFRGLFVLNTNDLDEAKAWLSGDMAIQEGVFVYNIIPWYGSAALPLYLEFHDQIWVEKP